MITAQGSHTKYWFVLRILITLNNSKLKPVFDVWVPLTHGSPRENWKVQHASAGNRRFGIMHVQLFSHMHGVEASGAVGLFVRTKVIIPNFICHNCTFCVQLRRLASDAKPTHGLVAAEMKLSQVQLSALRIASTCVPLRQWSCFQCYAISMAS